MNMDESYSMIRAEAALGERFREWWGKIPRVNFDPSWDVRAQPPFGGAMIRYSVEHKGAHVSIYMDAYDRLGCVGEPYWEIHPDRDGTDCERFLLNETDDLVAGIAASIAGQLERNKDRT